MNKRSGIKSKKRILDAAMRVFSECGYANANMRMIAKASNISIGGLYLYFKNKEDLYLTLMKSKMDDFAVKTMESVKDITDPAEAISTFMAMTLNYAKKHKGLILLQGRELGFTFGLEMKRKFFKKQRGLIEHIIRQGIRSGIFRKVNVPETARIIFSIIRGFVLSIVVEADALFSPEECSKLLLNGLLKKE
ncbi:MAG: TetR/AcrR family transcriptional regulator [Nitrospirota bacterium]|jgi:AcrR family transcriptional regulator|nr:TetR/AcrR family transcriptional regulator [Nitrospirota bacterium]